MATSLELRKLARLCSERDRLLQHASATTTPKNPQETLWNPIQNPPNSASSQTERGHQPLVVTETIQAVEKHKGGDEVDLTLLSPAKNTEGTSLSPPTPAESSKRIRKLPSLNKLRTLSRSLSEDQQQSSYHFFPSPEKSPERTKSRDLADLRSFSIHNAPLPVRRLYRSQSLKTSGSPQALRALSKLSQHPPPDPLLVRVPDQIFVPETPPPTMVMTSVDEDSWSSVSNTSNGDCLLQLGQLMDPHHIQTIEEHHPIAEAVLVEPTVRELAVVGDTKEEQKPEVRRRSAVSSLVRNLCTFFFYACLATMVYRGCRTTPTPNKKVGQVERSPPEFIEPPKSAREVQTSFEDTTKMYEGHRIPFDKARSDLDAVFASLQKEVQEQQTQIPPPKLHFARTEERLGKVSVESCPSHENKAFGRISPQPRFAQRPTSQRAPQLLSSAGLPHSSSRHPQRQEKEKGDSESTGNPPESVKVDEVSVPVKKGISTAASKMAVQSTKEVVQILRPTHVESDLNLDSSNEAAEVSGIATRPQQGGQNLNSDHLPKRKQKSYVPPQPPTELFTQQSSQVLRLQNNNFRTIRKILSLPFRTVRFMFRLLNSKPLAETTSGFST